MRTLQFACLRFAVGLHGLTRQDASTGYLFCSASAPVVEQRAQIERIGRNEILPQAGLAPVRAVIARGFSGIHRCRTNPSDAFWVIDPKQLEVMP
jgi:hypothetical protein